MLIQNRSMADVARELGCVRQSVQDAVKKVERHATRRLYSPEHHLHNPVPPGFTGKYTNLLVKDKSTGEWDSERIWVKGEADKQLQHEMYIHFIEGLAKTVKRAPATKAPKTLTKDLATAIIFGDAHLGMIAHAIETLQEDYNLEKATADIRAAIDYCISCAPASEEGWFVNVGDFTHTDDTKNETPAHGNRQDAGQRHFQTMLAAGQLIRYCIDQMLKKFGKVRVINARGNHDVHTAFALNLYIQGVYEKEPRVIVDTNQSKFTFVEFGKCLIGINHGDQIKAERLAGMMTKLQAEAWGRTTFRRYWLGHIHHKQMFEHESGITMESFHTLSATDAWHAASGYMAERRVTMITLHKEFGEVNRMSPSLEMVRAYQP